MTRCFAAARTTKHLNFSAFPIDIFVSDSIYVFTTDRWDLYAVVQSTLHEVWARKYSGALKQDLRYSPSDCFDTFPFPNGLWQIANPPLGRPRRTLPRTPPRPDEAPLARPHRHLQPVPHPRPHPRPGRQSQQETGCRKPKPATRASSNCAASTANSTCAIRDAYGWTALDLGHDFHEVETLPENDRVRYTISPAARKEVLKRLLAENHRRAAEKRYAMPPKTQRPSAAASPKPTTPTEICSHD